MKELGNDEPRSGDGPPLADDPAGGPHDGEQPDASDEMPISGRAGRDPANLGDDVPDEADLVYPPAEPATVPNI